MQAFGEVNKGLPNHHIPVLGKTNEFTTHWCVAQQKPFKFYEEELYVLSPIEECRCPRIYPLSPWANGVCVQALARSSRTATAVHMMRFKTEM